MERTGNYHTPVLRAFTASEWHGQKFDKRVVHPFATKQHRQAANPGDKTDDNDLAAIFRATVAGFEIIDAQTFRFLVTAPAAEARYTYALAAGTLLEADGDFELKYVNVSNPDNRNPGYVTDYKSNPENRIGRYFYPMGIAFCSLRRPASALHRSDG